jgi:hypothetical protein
MRKTLWALTIMAIFHIPSLAMGMDVAVEINGPQELMPLKEGVATTITTRCISRGIPLERYAKLAVAINRLGDVISYDALLETDPPRAFHKDMKDISALSATIDEMIGAIFAGNGAAGAAPVPPSISAVAEGSGAKIKLPFIPTSIAAIGEQLFVSDAKTVYMLTKEKASPLWKARGNNEILRIYPHGESLIVLARLMDGFQTFLLQGTEIKERWNKAVIPVGSGLVSSTLRFDRVFSPSFYQWTDASQVTGSSPQIPKDFDILCAIAADVRTSSTGPEVISYDASDRLTISDGRAALWTDADSTSITPLFIDEERKSGSNFDGDLPARYYLKPRILNAGVRIITFRNGQGAAGMVSRLNVFESAQIIAYSPAGEEFSREVLENFGGSYCVDIAIVQGKAAAVIVKDKSASVQFIGL